MRFTSTFTGKKDGIRARRRAARLHLPPLRLPLRHNRPLPAPSRLLPPLTSPSRAPGTLAKLTSVIGITDHHKVVTGLARLGVTLRGVQTIQSNVEGVGGT
jgi:hypothetical protein